MEVIAQRTKKKRGGKKRKKKKKTITLASLEMLTTLGTISKDLR